MLNIKYLHPRHEHKLLFFTIVLFMLLTACVDPVLDDPLMGNQPTLSLDAKMGGNQTWPFNDASLELDSGELDAITPSVDMDLVIDMALSIDMFLITDMAPQGDPCLGETCSGRGSCVTEGLSARCLCEDHYVAQGLNCLPEDRDGDGADFQRDCNDNNGAVYPNAPELCDELDQDCDGEIDEGACSIWVLEPRANRWESYPLNPSGSVAQPRGPIKAAWDIESEDLAFVLTGTGYHELRLSSLTWSPERPFTDIFSGQSGEIHQAFADSVPAGHGANPAMPLREGITISLIDGQGVKRIWQVSYIISQNRFIPTEGGLYNQEHTWMEPLSPDHALIRASWVDLENNRFLLNTNTQDLCGRSGQLSNIYLGLISAQRIHVLEAGACFLFVPSVPLIGSPLDLPNAPPWDAIGAAFFHQGAFYLLRGD